MKKKVITVCIPEDVWKEAKKRCIDMGISFSELVTMLLLKKLGDEYGKELDKNG